MLGIDNDIMRSITLPKVKIYYKISILLESLDGFLKLFFRSVKNINTGIHIKFSIFVTSGSSLGKSELGYSLASLSQVTVLATLGFFRHHSGFSKKVRAKRKRIKNIRMRLIFLYILWYLRASGVDFVLMVFLIPLSIFMTKCVVPMS